MTTMKCKDNFDVKIGARDHVDVLIEDFSVILLQCSTAGSGRKFHTAKNK